MMKTTAIKRAQIIGAVLLWGLAVQSAWTTSDSQSRVNLAYHPIVSTLGALAPAVVLAPFVYWMFGWILRRNAARFKAWEYFAETIKSEAKVCPLLRTRSRIRQTSGGAGASALAGR